jgi:hypothetical protein
VAEALAQLFALLKILVESQRIPNATGLCFQAKCVAQAFRISNGPGFEPGPVGRRRI